MSNIVYNVNSSLQFTMTLFKYLGFLSLDGNVGVRKYAAYLTVFFWIMFLNGNFIIWQVADLIVIWGDVILMTKVATLLLTNAAFTVKLLMFVYHRRTIVAVVQECNAELSDIKQGEYRDIVIQCSNETRNLQVPCCSAALLSIAMWGAGAGEKELPFRIWLPFDWTKSPAYEITFSYEVVALSLAAVLNVGCDFLVVSLITQCRYRLKLLSLSVQNICRDLEPNKQLRYSSVQEQTILARLKSCVRRHQAALQQARLMQHSFSTAVLAQFAVSSIILCVTLYELAFALKSFARAIGLVSYLIAIIIQVYIYCFQGNKLLCESLELATAAYSTPWYMCSSKVRKILLIFMIGSKRPVILTAAGLATLSLATFVAIMKASYSFFTVLQKSATDD